MDPDFFIQEYLQPCACGPDPRFVLPLPPVEGLAKDSDLIVQSRRQSTVSTNIISTWSGAAGDLRLVEVYKNTQNQATGAFVRLVGTMALLRRGFPFLFLDAAVANIDFRNGARQDLKTQVAVHLPQAGDRERERVMAELDLAAGGLGAAGTVRTISGLPAFWGPLWSAAADGACLEFIAALRQAAWKAYEDSCVVCEPDAGLDYTPTRQQMVLVNAQRESELFCGMGLAVPAEAQAAFFSVLSWVP